MDGDGYADIIIGAENYGSGDHVGEQGWVSVYLGSAAGLGDYLAWSATGGWSTAHLGCSVATAGDVNGDGYADIIAGAYSFDPAAGFDGWGAAFVWHGSAAGLGASGAAPDTDDWYAYGGQEGSYFGWSVSSAGDVNGDGYSDVIVGAPEYDFGDEVDEGGQGMARLYLGSSSGLNDAHTRQLAGIITNGAFGTSVSSAGDVNGDGYGDIIVGEPYFADDLSNQGRAYVWYGSTSGISTYDDWDWDVVGGVSDHYGTSVATAGDVNGDGYSDIIVGAPFDATGAGTAYAYYGSSSSLQQTAGWTKDSDQEEAHFGHSVASAGDVDADGYADLIVGAPQWDGGLANEGGAWIYMGAGGGLEDAPAWHKESDQANAQYGWSVSSAGDVDGDGYDDVIVGVPYYDFDELVRGWCGSTWVPPRARR